MFHVVATPFLFIFCFYTAKNATWTMSANRWFRCSPLSFLSPWILILWLLRTENTICARSKKRFFKASKVHKKVFLPSVKFKLPFWTGSQRRLFKGSPFSSISFTASSKKKNNLVAVDNDYDHCFQNPRKLIFYISVQSKPDLVCDEKQKYK
jgi:hypothetical protein